MTKLMNIQTQIDKLQKQAAEIRAKDFQSTIQEILAKMQAFDITVKDLQAAKPAKVADTGRGKVKLAVTKSNKAPKAAKNPVAAKYRGPNGETWSGRGLTPRWLAALIAQGQSKDAFAVNA